MTHKTISNKGFTLIELLVVIAIIGIIATISLVSLSSARKKARDARRISDLYNIKTALELYYHENGQYPADPVSTQVSNMNTGASDITAYLNPIPTDPTNTGANGYRYRISNTNGQQSYTMLVKLEKNPNWCSLGVAPGHSGWNNSNGTQYPPCQF